MSSYVNCLGGTCPHMPFFIGGGGGGGGGEMSYTHHFLSFLYKIPWLKFFGVVT